MNRDNPLADEVQALTERLSAGARRVLRVALAQPALAGKPERVYLAWHDGGVLGHKGPGAITKRMFMDSLRELARKRLLAEASPQVYWLHPALAAVARRREVADA